MHGAYGKCVEDHAPCGRLHGAGHVQRPPAADRSGRFGRKGVAINFVTADDVRAMREIEVFYNTKIDEMPMDVADLI